VTDAMREIKVMKELHDMLAAPKTSGV